MKELEKMTRKELATLLVEKQIANGTVPERSKDYVIKRVLADNLGTYASKEYLVNLLKNWY